MTKRLFSILNLLFFSLLTIAQTTISGVVNDYYAVSAISQSDYSARATSTPSLQPNDLVLIIQMQGAQIDETQSSSFGTILDYNSAGNYEFQRVCSVTGSTVFFKYPFQHTFDVNGSVQMIKVPEYTNGAKLGGILTGDEWNGSTGGILAIKSDASLDLDQFSVTMTGKGFRGGAAIESGGGCVFISPSTYHSSRTSANERALKGEGIANYITGKDCSRGPQANGGGGGNNHNGGGSGGSNYGIGGAGGQRVKSSNFSCGSLAGLNSKSLATEIDKGRVFMGGGGGAGHGNNAGLVGESGENGGGIIFIIAPEITGTNRSGIFANGNTGKTNSENEGGGGGGAGGSIILDVTTIPSGINLAANGGNGVFVTNFGTNCSGPGGGGGGGIVAFTGSSIPSSVNINTIGGNAGEIASSSQGGCNVGDKNGGTNGTNGKTLTDFTIEDNTKDRILQDSITACNKYVSPSGKIWTEDGTYRDTVLNAGGCEIILDLHLTIQNIDTSIKVSRYVSILGMGFPIAWESNESNASYQWYYKFESMDSSYALAGQTKRQIDMDSIGGRFGDYFVIITKNGCKDTSAMFNYYIEGIGQSHVNFKLTIAPNPSNKKFSITSKEANIKNATIYDIAGHRIKSIKASDQGMIEGELSKKGIYIIEINTSTQTTTRKLIIH